MSTDESSDTPPGADGPGTDASVPADPGPEAPAAAAPEAAEDPNAWAYAPQPKLPPRAPSGPEGVPSVTGSVSGGPGPVGVPAPGIAKGQDWGTPLTGPVDAEVLGTDSMLVAQYEATPDAVISFLPTGNSDLARTLGLPTEVYAAAEPTQVRALDVLDAASDGLAVNAIMLGVAPELLQWGSPAATMTVEVDGEQIFAGKATTVVVASGQFVNGMDLVPRGHPGDGKFEVQVYSFGRFTRKALGPKVRSGSHIPHAKIRERSGASLRVTCSRALPLALDGRSGGSAATLEVTIRPGVLQLAV